MANLNPVWYNIFRKIVLKPDNITLEAETYNDTINILRGPGVAWQGYSDEDTSLATGNDTFMIDVDYDISIPLASTDLTLEDVNGNTSAVTFTAGRGVEILRNSAQELEWRSYSVTETDTLQTVTERNNITNNKIFVNNIEVGTISSSFTEDGFPSYDAGHNLVGDGTLDSPLKFSPDYQDSLMANSSDQFEFTALGPGMLAYSASYVFDTGATTGSVTLEREDPSSPGTWVVLDIISGVSVGHSYDIQGIYSESYSGNVNYRLTYVWTGNLGVITWHVQNTFEGGAYTPITSPQLKTDTDAKTVDINDLQFFQNNIRTTVSNTDIVLDPAGAGKVLSLSNITAPTFTGDVTGNLTGNADTVTNGVYTTGSYADPSWITSLDAAKIVGSIQLSDITIDGDLRLFDNVITTSQSNSDIVLDPNGTGKVRILSNIVSAGFEGNLIGNADTVTNGVYTVGLYTDPAWIISLDGTKVTNAVLTTGSYADPSWITSLDAAKIVGDIQLKSFIIDNSIRIDGTLIETIVSNANLELRANGSGVVYISDSLTVTDAITFNTTTNNQSYTTTGAGTITITSGTTGNINNMNIGASTAGTGRFTSGTITSTVSSTSNTTDIPTTAWVRDQGGFRSQVVFTTGTSTWTIPTGITKIKVTVVGAGGGGGGVSAVASAAGAGGGGGGMSVSYYTGLTPGNTLSYSVGTGGTAGTTAGGAGGAGGNTTVSANTEIITTLQANGGSGGNGATTNTITVGGAGASAGSGPANAILMAGYLGGTADGGRQKAGNGANGPLGGGGGQGKVSTTGAGSAATNYGAGGGGALGATANTGGAGSGGIIIIEY